MRTPSSRGRRTIPVLALLLALVVLVPGAAGAAPGPSAGPRAVAQWGSGEPTFLLQLSSNEPGWRPGPANALIIAVNGQPTHVPAWDDINQFEVPKGQVTLQLPQVVKEHVDGRLTCWTFSSWDLYWYVYNPRYVDGHIHGTTMTISQHAPIELARVLLFLHYENWGGDCPGY
jgi:hypothetical protein